MSMTTTGASGYIVKAEAFTSLLPETVRDKFAQAIAEQDTQLVDEILGENAPPEFPTFESSFTLQEECANDAPELDLDTVYICFQDEDLFVLTPKPELNWLRNKGIDPQFQRWTVWG